MRSGFAIAYSISLAVALGACNAAAPSTTVPLTAPAASSSSPNSVTASVKVVPADITDLSFAVAGPVSDVAVKEGDHVKAGQALVSLDEPDLAYANAAAQAALNSAQADAFIQSQGRRKWDGFKFVWVSGPPEQRQEANARVDQARAGLSVAQAQLAQATLRAPFDGTVVTVAATQGEILQPNQLAITIGSLNHLQIESTDLSERSIARVRIGQEATIRLKAFAAPLSGHVSAIAPLAGKSADGDTVFKVTIELDQQPEGLMWGMTGDVEIQTP